REVPAAQQPQSRARRAGVVRAVPQGTARRGQARSHRHAGQVRRAVAPARRHAHLAAARQLARVRRHSRHAHLPSRLPAPLAAGEGEGLGGSAGRDEEAGAEEVIAALLLAPVVAYAELTGSVDPGSGDFLLEAIRESQDKGVEALLVRIDTPGGLLSTTRDVVQAELSAKVPIIF